MKTHPHLGTLLGPLCRQLEKVRRAWHFRVGPSSKRLDAARRALKGREYYSLYDEIYQEIDRVESENRDRELAAMRNLCEEDFQAFRNEGLIPEPSAALIDLGCGDGSSGIFFAKLGYRVTGIDISPVAIEMANRKARARGFDIDFRVADVVRPEGIAEDAFDVATDIRCLHMLVKAEHRRNYLQSIARLLHQNGVLFLFTHLSFKDVEIEDEEEHILCMTAWTQKRFMADSGARLNCRGCGFRSASLEQYEKELDAAGFEMIHRRTCSRGQFPFVALLARRKERIE